ncbi:MULTISPECIES: hypothetical protein [Enterobacterales]|uniref:hypothetical protein n=1 Tax=Enterobacterales TaxID=91347 RepID=UPI002ED9B477
MVANVIYRGPAEREPKTLTRQVSAQSLPGAAVIIAGGKFAAASAATGRWLILSNNRFVGQSISEMYSTNDTANAYRVEGEQEYNVQLAAGTYTAQQELTIGTGGIFKAATTGNLVVAAFDESATRTLSAQGFGDIVILSRAYLK